MKTGFGIETTVIPLLREDGRARFAHPRSTGERLLDWALGTLWFLAAVVLAAAVWWF